MLHCKTTIKCRWKDKTGETQILLKVQFRCRVFCESLSFPGNRMYGGRSFPSPYSFFLLPLHCAVSCQDPSKLPGTRDTQQLRNREPDNVRFTSTCSALSSAVRVCDGVNCIMSTIVGMGGVRRRPRDRKDSLLPPSSSSASRGFFLNSGIQFCFETSVLVSN